MHPTSGHYDALEIGKHATPDSVRRAYKRKALATHPDKKGGSKVAFEKVVAAYEVLLNAPTRSEYDASLIRSGSSDGTYWSSANPGTASSSKVYGAGVSKPETERLRQAEEDDLLQKAEEVAMKAWLRSFQEEFDVSGLSLLELTTLVDTWRAQLQETQHAPTTEKEEDRAWAGKGAQVIANISCWKGNSCYRVSFQINRMNIMTQYTSPGNLEQAIEWHGALLKAIVMARRRIGLSPNPQNSEPLTESELIAALVEQPNMRLHFRVNTGTSSSRLGLWSPTTRNLHLALSFWRLPPFKKMDNSWKRSKTRLMQQARDLTLLHAERCSKMLEAVSRAIRASAVAADRQQSSTAAMLEQVRALQAIVEEVRNDQNALTEDNRYLANRVVELEGKLAIKGQPVGSTPPKDSRQLAKVNRPRRAITPIRM